MSIEQLREDVAEEFTTADIMELANKACELKKQNMALIEIFETFVELLEAGDKNMNNLSSDGHKNRFIARICREQLRRILDK